MGALRRDGVCVGVGVGGDPELAKRRPVVREMPRANRPIVDSCGAAFIVAGRGVSRQGWDGKAYGRATSLLARPSKFREPKASLGKSGGPMGT